MLLRGSYLAYKRETSKLVFLLVTASNAILSVRKAKARLNTSGKLDSAGFVPLAELIGKHMRRVPREILRLLKSVIELRTSHYAEFQRRVSANPSFEMEESNRSHKHFIDVLSRAFEILGGERGLARGEDEDEKAGAKTDDAQVSNEECQAFCSNVFACLDLEHVDGSEEEEEAEDVSGCDAGEAASQSCRARKALPKAAKNKNGKCSRGRKSSNKKHKRQSPLRTLSIDQYGISDDHHHVAAEYFLAVSSFLEQSIDLRSMCQSSWYRVAYSDEQPLDAIAMSEQSIAVLQKSHTTISSEFPGSHSYMSLINAYTKGGIHHLQPNTTIRINLQPKDGACCVSMKEIVVSRESMRELLMEHAYNNLVEFLSDYRKTSSGGPTKHMRAEISLWDPKYDLEAATADERLRWRRVYTINWLYGLVGYYLLTKGQIGNLSTNMKSRNCPNRKAAMAWAEDYSFFGLGEFARSVLSLARKPAGSQIESLISPCLVFQLQCIVDSFTVSRGWTVGLHRHILEAPPAEDGPPCNQGAMGWFTRLTCANECHNHQGLSRSREWLGELHSSAQTRRGSFCKDTLDEVWRHWGFHHRFIIDIRNETAPDFRANGTDGRLDEHGLFYLSPFLCGFATLQTIELFYRYAMLIWDTNPEIILMLHLHNMLHQTGVLKEAVELMAKLTSAFMADLFGEKAPTSDFYQAFMNRKGASRFTTYSLLKPLLIGTPSFKQFYMSERFFKTRSSFLVFHEAGWDTAAVSSLRISSLNEQASLRNMISHLKDRSSFNSRKRLAKLATPGHSINLPHFHADSKDIHESQVFTMTGYALGRDLCVCCPAPLSGINFLAVTAKLLSIWIAIEERLKLSGHVHADRVDPAISTWDGGSVESVVVSALQGDDGGLHKVLAEVFEETSANIQSVSYFALSNEKAAKGQSGKGEIDGNSS
ncbi:hypothetical protein E4U42_001175 [Claviceps africana]|uniref:DUF6604 domain-containing protein n=1 Tax=Claviceps africana TaxID=83212 RepID=A0A8K0JAX9_9HYPO|nr:hypothetical protein E4U42_001175 [Claviceps africana]